jgi:hypothetical protein
MKHQISISGINVEVVRKDIKNLHIGVYPPEGRVRVAAPFLIDDDAVRLAVISKLSWIKRQKAHFREQPRQSKREYIRRESHYFLGRRYLLNIKEHDGPARVEIRSNRTRSSLCDLINLFVFPIKRSLSAISFSMNIDAGNGKIPSAASSLSNMDIAIHSSFTFHHQPQPRTPHGLVGVCANRSCLPLFVAEHHPQEHKVRRCVERC